MNESSSDDEIPRKKSRVTFESESEDDALPGTSTMSVAEVVCRASSSKKKYTARARLYSETEDNAIRNILLELDCIARQKIMLYLQLLQ